jgi:hypothetical protein
MPPHMYLAFHWLFDLFCLQKQMLVVDMTRLVFCTMNKDDFLVTDAM